jgi:cardiolipin synthase
MPDGGRFEDGTAASLLNLPNIVTFARLCAVPLAFWLVVEHRTGQAFLLFVAAGLSDALDGWLARRYGGNAVGAVMDPVADKALLVTMYITLAAVGALPDWLAILVVFRDALIVGGIVALAVMGHSVTIHPLYISKVNTLLQIVLVAITLLQSGFGLGVPGLGPLLVWVVALTTLASGAAYVWNTARGDSGAASGPG